MSVDERRVFRVTSTFELPRNLGKPGRLPRTFVGPCPFRWDKSQGELEAWAGRWRLDGAYVDESRTFRVTAVESFCLQVIREGAEVGLLVEEIV